MQLDGFHVVRHPQCGIFLGEGEPRPECAHLPAARQIWSTFPNLLLSAPVYRSAGEVRAKTAYLYEGWDLYPVSADLLMNGQVYASMLCCIEAGLEPWIGGAEYESSSYIRTTTPAPFYGAIAAQLQRYCDQMAVEIRHVPTGLCWTIRPADMTKTREVLIARARLGVGAGWD